MTPISVAMATYNGERFLEAQLESLRAQTHQPRELVVCDDGSTDGTVAIVRRFAATSPFPVHVHVNPRRLGAPGNFLQAASLCTGEFIAFCDQDDVWEDAKLERCREVLRYGSALVVHESRVVDEQLRPDGGMHPRIRRTRTVPPLGIDPWLAVPGHTMVFAARLLTLVAHEARPAFPNLGDKVPHDIWIYLVAGVVGRTTFLAEPLAVYRQHGANVIGPPEQRSCRRWRASLRVGAPRYTDLRDLAHDLSAFFEAEALCTASSDLRRRFGSAARLYRRAEDIFALRASLYGRQHNFASRLRLLARLIRSRGYGGREHGGLGLPSMAKDVAVAILGSARVARETPSLAKQVAP